jgi:DNA ligase D-like protein (predicted 3'-phosphoesterase)
MLLQPGFDRSVQGVLWEDAKRPSRYAVKLHRASTLHYDLRLELCGRLFSLVLAEPPRWDARPVKATRVGDHDARYLLTERAIPAGQYGAGPMLVWDHGSYESATGADDAYDRLLNGELDFTLHGVRLNGTFRLTGREENWSIRRLDAVQSHRPNDMRSVVSGRSLDEIDSATPAGRSTRLAPSQNSLSSKEALTDIGRLPETEATYSTIWDCF